MFPGLSTPGMVSAKTRRPEPPPEKSQRSPNTSMSDAAIQPERIMKILLYGNDRRESDPPETERASISTQFGIEPEVPLQVLIPKHIRTQLGVLAANEGKSLRAVVLTAIRGLGISITDEEIRDKRGRRRT